MRKHFYGFRVGDDSQQRRFIFPLRFHRRGLLIAMNRGGNATRSASAFPRYSIAVVLGDRDATELLGSASECCIATQFFDVLKV